jgi:hypothetical protein
MITSNPSVCANAAGVSQIGIAAPASFSDFKLEAMTRKHNMQISPWLTRPIISRTKTVRSHNIRCGIPLNDWFARRMCTRLPDGPMQARKIICKTFAYLQVSTTYARLSCRTTNYKICCIISVSFSFPIFQMNKFLFMLGNFLQDTFAVLTRD